jgi:hypothetical protein
LIQSAGFWLIREAVELADYPLKDLTKSWSFASGLTWLAFADGWMARSKGLIRLIKGAL